MTRSIDRDELGFENAVAKEFRFLETDYGFERSRTPGGSISYTSPKIEVLVSYDYEIWVTLVPEEPNRGKPLTVNNLMQPPVTVSLLDVLKMRQLSTRDRPPTAMTRNQVQKFVREAAQQLRQVGTELIRGDLGVFNEVIEYHRPSVERRRLERNVRDLKRAINYAWKQDDYVTLLQAWDELQALESVQIEESYKRKAAYAERYRQGAQSRVKKFMSKLNRCRYGRNNNN